MKEWGYAPGIDKQGEIERPVGLLETGSSKGRTGGVGVRTQCCGAVVVISGLFIKALNSVISRSKPQFMGIGAGAAIKSTDNMTFILDECIYSRFGENIPSLLLCSIIGRSL